MSRDDVDATRPEGDRDTGVDLLALAAELAVSPQEGQRRRVPPLLWFVFFVATWALLLAAVIILLSGMTADLRNPDDVGPRIIGALAAAGGAAFLALAIVSDRTVTAVGKVVVKSQPFLWGGSLAMSFVLSVSVAVLSGAGLISAEHGDPASFVAVGSLAIVGAVFAANASALARPLLHSARRSHAGQAKWSLHAWIAVIVAGTSLSAWGIASIDGIGFAVAVPLLATFALASMGWQGRNVRELAETRASLLEALDSAIDAFSQPPGAHAERERTSALLRIHSLVASSPFDATLPFGTPTRASWDVRTILLAVLDRRGVGVTPPAVARRPNLFSDFNRTHTSTLDQETHQFLTHLRWRLISAPDSRNAPTRTRLPGHDTTPA